PTLGAPPSLHSFPTRRSSDLGSESIDAADRSRLMAIGQAYQSTVWPGEITEIVENSSVSQVKGKVSYIPMPAGPSGKGCSSLCLDRKSTRLNSSHRTISYAVF